MDVTALYAPSMAQILGIGQNIKMLYGSSQSQIKIQCVQSANANFKNLGLFQYYGIRYIDLAVSSVFFMTSSAVSPFSAAISSATYLR